MSRLYNNLKLNLEAVDFKNTNNVVKNKLEFYHLLMTTELDDDIKYSDTKEEALVNQFCNLEATYRSRIGKEANEILKTSLGINNLDDEKNLFAKIFIRDYLASTNNDENLALKDNLNAGVLFYDFASEELQNNKDFAKTILSLDGRYMPYMSEEVRNNSSLMSIAINNDTTEEVESFTRCDSNLLRDSKMAGLYLEKSKKNKGYKFNATNVYETIFKKDENELYTTKVFENQVQADWLQDEEFLVDVAKLDNGFIKYIVEGKISLNLNNTTTSKTLKK